MKTKRSTFEPGADRLLQEVERALHVDGDELRIVVRLDVRLVQRAAPCTIASMPWSRRDGAPGAIDDRAHDLGGRPGRDRGRPPCGRRARAAAPGSGRASLTNPSPGCSSRRFRRYACQYVVHDVGGPSSAMPCAGTPTRLVVGEPGPFSSCQISIERQVDGIVGVAASRACRRADCRRTPRRRPQFQPTFSAAAPWSMRAKTVMPCRTMMASSARASRRPVAARQHAQSLGTHSPASVNALLARASASTSKPRSGSRTGGAS